MDRLAALETVPEPEPEPAPAIPDRADAMFYYQHGELPVPLLQSHQADQVPRDGSLYLAVANSIDADSEEPNTPTVGSEWDAGKKAVHLWWNHRYGQSAGTRLVFQRFKDNAGWPIGLLPYAGQTIYALIDFCASALPIGQQFPGGWLTWPFELKAHNPWGSATISANLNAQRELWWGNLDEGRTTRRVFMTPTPIQEGRLYRVTMRIDQRPTDGRFQASIDGAPVVEVVGQMAMRIGAWPGCAVFIPCLYGNMLSGRMDGYIKNMIVSTEPLS